MNLKTDSSDIVVNSVIRNQYADILGVYEYEIIGRIARCSFSEILLARRMVNGRMTYAIKKVDVSFSDVISDADCDKQEVIFKEAAILKALNHPNIIKLHSVLYFMDEVSEVFMGKSATYFLTYMYIMYKIYGFDLPCHTQCWTTLTLGLFVQLFEVPTARLLL